MSLISRLLIATALLMAEAASASGPQLIWGFSEYPPFKYKEGGVYRGIDAALMRQIAHRMGLTLKVVECPLKRCIELLRNGEVDVLTAFGQRPEREEFTHFVNPPYNVDNYKAFYTKKGSGVKIESFDDLPKYVIGTKNGAKYFPRFDEEPLIRKEEVYEVRQNLEKLAAGRIDAVVNTEIEFDYMIARLGFDGRFEKQPYRGEPGMDYIGLSKRSALFKRKDELEQIVRSLVDSGEIERIVDELFDMVRREAAEAEAQRIRTPASHGARPVAQ
jgi:polar amino acid transport system substrate-binding protein